VRWMTWLAVSVRPWDPLKSGLHLDQEMRVQSALDDVASSIRQTLGYGGLRDGGSKTGRSPRQGRY
jgi:hypothetical protein